VIQCVRGARRHVVLPVIAMPISYVAGQQSAIARKTYAEGHRWNGHRGRRSGRGANFFAPPAPTSI
jgi:hypothetical protein